jgi:uncharacterized damage-inducible protein DinB
MKKLLVALLLILPMAGFCQNVFQQEFLGMFGYDEGQILSLGEAIPEDKFDWRPADGVRSIGDAFLHIASTNYYVTMSMGFTLPAGVDMTKIESTKGKAKIMELVKSSFAYVKESTGKVTDANLTDKFKMPFGEFTKRSGLLLLLNHSGEHKGQLIAYARMNNITPPWSKKGGE